MGTSKIRLLFATLLQHYSHLIKMIQYANFQILIFMNMNESIRNKRKLVEELGGYTYKITYMSTANYHRLQNLVPNSSSDILF